MIKNNYGDVENVKTGKRVQVICKSQFGCKPLDLMIGSCLVIGGLLYVAGKSFTNGCTTYCKEELKALEKAGIINDSEDIIHDILPK